MLNCISKHVLTLNGDHIDIETELKGDIDTTVYHNTYDIFLPI